MSEAANHVTFLGAYLELACNNYLWLAGELVQLTASQSSFSLTDAVEKKESSPKHSTSTRKRPVAPRTKVFVSQWSEPQGSQVS